LQPAPFEVKTMRHRLHQAAAIPVLALVMATGPRAQTSPGFMATEPCAPQPAQTGSIVPAADAAALARFQAGIDEYVGLHRQLEGPLPVPAVSSDVAKIRAASDALAGAIRGARARARQGDVFTPDVTAMIQGLIRRALEGRDPAEVVAAINEEVPPGAPPRPSVHSRYPVGASTYVPCELLTALPALPPELQYRFVGRTLLLLDTHADLVVDLMPEAIPAR
jgi:hypothetical protein